MIERKDVERVLGYLRKDEAEIRSEKANVVWADTMARAADLIRTLAADHPATLPENMRRDEVLSY